MGVSLLRLFSSMNVFIRSPHVFSTLGSTRLNHSYYSALEYAAARVPMIITISAGCISMT